MINQFSIKKGAPVGKVKVDDGGYYIARRLESDSEQTPTPSASKSRIDQSLDHSDVRNKSALDRSGLDNSDIQNKSALDKSGQKSEAGSSQNRSMLDKSRGSSTLVKAGQQQFPENKLDSSQNS